MQVTAIKINNILGIEHLEIKPGALTVIGGENGAGKTSVLEAIQAVVKGGHDATLLRKGAEHGEVVIVLDNGVQITKKVTKEKSQTNVIDPKLGKVSKVAAYIDGLTDALSVNPVDFLTCSKAERLEVLLKAMPIEVDIEALKAITPENFHVTGSHAFEKFKTLHDYLYMLRRDVFRDLKGKKVSIVELRKSLPEGGTDKDWAAEAEMSETELKALEAEEAEKRSRVNVAWNTKDADVTRVKDSCLAEITAEYDLEYKAMIKRKEAEIAKTYRRATKEIEKNTVKRAAEFEMLDKEYTGKIQDATAAVAVARVKAEEQIKAKNTQGIIDGFKEEAGALDLHAGALSVSLVDLKALELKTLENLPIKDLEIKDGEIYCGGVVFDRLNTMQQIEIAIEVVKLRTKDLPLICVDGLERMDAAHIKTFEETIRAAGLQAIVTKVAAEGPLTVVNA